MKSIRAKISLLTMTAIIVTMCIGILINYTNVKDIGQYSADQILVLMCESGQKNLDSYFSSIERSVGIVSSYAETDLRGLDKSELQAHVDRVSNVFRQMSERTNGILTYYYRIDPEFSEDVTGFWFINLGRQGLVEHEVTDLTAYEIENEPGLVWFSVPKYSGEAVWLPPYITENLGERVLSYNVPIYQDGVFVGVIGIEIDYAVMATQVDNIRLFDNGYAFINDNEGNIIYHPNIDVLSLPEDQIPKVPDGLLSGKTINYYEFEGVEKKVCCLPLSNGMNLNVSVPVSELNDEWENLVYNISFISVILLLVFVIITIIYTGKITKPLRKLTHAAEQINEGNYDVEVSGAGNDEVGLLTNAFNKLITNVKAKVDELNELNRSLKEDNLSLEAATIRDSLTGVKNRFALRRDYDEYIEKDIHLMMLDIDDFKRVNDNYGHAVGDFLLKKLGDALTDQFGTEYSYRYGGDEFLVVYPDIPEADFMKAITNLEAQLEEIYLEDKKLPVHFSAGYVYGNTVLKDDLRLMLKHADELLYQAKKQGKNAFIGSCYERSYAESLEMREEGAYAADDAALKRT